MNEKSNTKFTGRLSLHRETHETRVINVSPVGLTVFAIVDFGESPKRSGIRKIHDRVKFVCESCLEVDVESDRRGDDGAGGRG